MGKSLKFHFNPLYLENFTYNIEQFLYSNIGAIQVYIMLLILVIRNIFKRF